ncbi:MAG: coenzyme F420-0:L-glutamate ligase [Nevskia sp.]|nr:coenzyme F420-0:L-glutamate ligase [Nevskia sp.]
MQSGALSFLPLAEVPEVEPGADLAGLLRQALTATGEALADGDVVVVAQKIVSKSENRYVELASVEPRPEALDLARLCGKDPRVVELVLRESSEVLRVAPNVLIVRHRLGFVVANAAIDQSNLPGGAGRALLLPTDPDASAAGLRQALAQAAGANVAVLISDSFGRPWRLGVTGVCVGCAGLDALADARGTADRNGRPLQVTQIAVADQLCAAATLVGGEAAEGTPLVLVRGVSRNYLSVSRPASVLLRPREQDLFR